MNSGIFVALLIGASAVTGSAQAQSKDKSASPAAASAAPTPSTGTVSIVSSAGNTAYKPNPVMANSGDTVVFRNNDVTMHHIMLDDGSADLGDVSPGATSKGVTLKNSNAARFHCTIHSTMVGTINEASAPPTPPCPDPYGYGC